MRFLILLLIYINIYASDIKLNYVGEFSIFGQIGIANINYKKTSKKYSITVNGSGTGVVGEITNNKLYTIQSIGIVKNGILIPTKYIKSETNPDYNKTKTYIFDHDNNKTIVKKYKREKKTISDLNILTMQEDVSYKIIEENTTNEIDEVFYDDMVSMFFNKRHNLLSMKKDETKLIKAAGSKDTQKGVIVKMVEKKDNKTTFSISIKQDYLEGGSEDLYVVLDDDNIVYETTLEGVLFFGDAKVKRKSKLNAK